MDAIVRQLFAILIRLGGLGLLILGIFDSSFLFMPLGNDLLLVALVARDRSLLLPYAAMATAGSVLGCLLIDWISRKGGEEGLPKIVPARQLKYVERRVRKNAAWAITLASIMPPPFPFTPFVAAASAFQYPKKKLLGLIAITRFARFFLVGMLAVVFGQSIIRMAKTPAVRTVILAIIALSMVGSVISVYSWIKRSRRV